MRTVRWPTPLLLIFMVLATAVLGAGEDFAPAPVQAPVATGTAKPVGEAAPATRSPPAVGLIVINDQIDEHRSRYFKRALVDARTRKLDLVVVHMTSDGGLVSSGEEMVDAALDAQAKDLRLVCFVDNRAWSGGALIAYAHRELLMTTAARIGDIGVIHMFPDGRVEYGPEKLETAVRATLRRLAEANGWNTAKLLKMTARNQDLYRFDLPGGPEWVIEDDLPSWLAAHPTVKPESKVLILGKDRLLSYTAREAVDHRMATALVADLDAVYQRLGVSPGAVVDLRPSRIERTAWAVAPFASLLMGLTMLFIFLEFKAPSGLFLSLAIASGTLFFVCQYYQELAGNLELVMILLGAALIIAEIFWLPTSGIVGFAGLALAVLGVVLAFMPDNVQFSPSTEGWGAILGGALAQSSLTLAIVTVGLVLFIRALPHLKLVNRIATTAEITATSAGDDELNAASIIGRHAVARGDLRPSGFIDCAGNELSATTENSEYLAAGTEVEIIAMRFGEAIVRPVTAPGGAAT